MKNFIQIVIILILFSSCYTIKTAQKQVIKAHLNYPETTSGFCAETFPVKENVVEKTKFIKGETIVKKDTVTVDCDSVVNDKNTSNKVLIQYETIYQTDTIFKEKIIEKENTAKTKSLQLQLKAKNKIIADKEDVISEKQQLIEMLKYGLIALIIAVLLLIFIKR